MKSSIVFLHGFLGVKEDWNEIVSHLENKYTCFLFDLPGHGKAPYAQGWEESLFDQIKYIPSPIHLVGYSMGGRIAMRLVEVKPELFGKKVFLSSHVGLKTEKEKIKQKEKEERWIRILKEESYDSFLKKWYEQDLFSPLTSHPNWNQILERRKKQNPENILKVYAQMALSNQSSYTLTKDCLLLFGEKDLKYETLYTNISNLARFTRVPHASHAVHLENPIFCAKQIEEFIA